MMHKLQIQSIENTAESDSRKKKKKTNIFNLSASLLELKSLRVLLTKGKLDLFGPKILVIFISMCSPEVADVDFEKAF